MQKIIYFIGSLPRRGEAPVGGGEVGNSRTVRMLESFGFDVQIIRRIRSKASDTRLKRLITYPLRFISNTMLCFLVLMKGNKKDGIVHIAGFYGPTIAIETFQVAIARFFGYKIVYELRGGGATSYFENGSTLYKKQFKYILKNADFLFSQGKENEPLLNSICSTPIYYYPNCVKKEFYPEDIPSKPKDKINLVFWGRIEYEKNPFLIIETASLLQERYDNITLTMIGNGQKDFLDQVKNMMNSILLPNSFTFLPGCEHNELQKFLKDKHFFIFPSMQPREGQSNAVTEAMSFGIIPIASPQGFSRSTIGDNNLIVEDLTAEAYASRISRIIDNGDMERYSQFVRNRFDDNYTEKAVFERTKIEYIKICNAI